MASRRPDGEKGPGAFVRLAHEEEYTDPVTGEAKTCTISTCGHCGEHEVFSSVVQLAWPAGAAPGGDGRVGVRNRGC